MKPYWYGWKSVQGFAAAVVMEQRTALRVSGAHSLSKHYQSTVSHSSLKLMIERICVGLQQLDLPKKWGGLVLESVIKGWQHYPNKNC